MKVLLIKNNRLYIKWSSIKESRTENKNLRLEDIKFNDYKLIIDEQSNTLYYSLINNSQNKYNPNVSYDANNKNHAKNQLEYKPIFDMTQCNHQNLQQ